MKGDMPSVSACRPSATERIVRACARLLPALALTVGLILCLAAGPRLEPPLRRMAVVVLALGLLAAGSTLWLSARTPRWRVAAACVTLALLLSLALGASRWEGPPPSAPPPLGAPKTPEAIARSVLAGAVQTAESGSAQLGLETARVLYSIHSRSETVELPVPPDGVLDVAWGIAPELRNFYRGTLTARIDVEAGTSSRVVLEKSFSLRYEKKLGWRQFSVDLSSLAGKRVRFHFRKDWAPDGTPEHGLPYDLEPTDLCYWSQPQVRPRRLGGRPNVVLVSLDTMRADRIHALGYPRQTTPTLDRLTREGTYFTQAISQAPWTLPSHFSLFTSTLPTTHGATQPASEVVRFWNTRLETMASLLSRAGYLCAAYTGSGSISARLGLDKGFDLYNETAAPKHSDAAGVFPKAMSWLSEHSDRTFFLFVHTYEAHEPYTSDHFVDREAIAPEDETARRIARYDGDVREADSWLGRLTSRLEELGLAENTLLIVTSDHGEDLVGRPGPRLGHGHSLYDEVLRVPLLLLGPRVPAGKRVDAQVRLIDILPTVVDYVGLRSSRQLQGLTLRPLVEGHRKTGFPAPSEAPCYGPDRKSVRSESFKYIRRVAYGYLWTPESHGMALTPLEELYDLGRDPDETVNLASTHADRLAVMRGVLGEIAPDGGAWRTGVERNRGSSTLDPALREQLKSLGYVQ